MVGLQCVCMVRHPAVPPWLVVSAGTKRILGYHFSLFPSISLSNEQITRILSIILPASIIWCMIMVAVPTPNQKLSPRYESFRPIIALRCIAMCLMPTSLASINKCLPFTICHFRHDANPCNHPGHATAINYGYAYREQRKATARRSMQHVLDNSAWLIFCLGIVFFLFTTTLGGVGSTWLVFVRQVLPIPFEKKKGVVRAWGRYREIGVVLTLVSEGGTYLTYLVDGYGTRLYWPVCSGR